MAMQIVPAENSFRRQGINWELVGELGGAPPCRDVGTQTLLEMKCDLWVLSSTLQGQRKEQGASLSAPKPCPAGRDVSEHHGMPVPDCPGCWCFVSCSELFPSSLEGRCRGWFSSPLPFLFLRWHLQVCSSGVEDVCGI